MGQDTAKKIEESFHEDYFDNAERDAFNEYLSLVTNFESKVFNAMWIVNDVSSATLSLSFVPESYYLLKNIANTGCCSAAQLAADLFNKQLIEPFSSIWASLLKNETKQDGGDISVFQDNDQKLRILKTAMLIAQFCRMIAFFQEQKSAEQITEKVHLVSDSFNKNRIQSLVNSMLNFIKEDHFKNKISTFQFSLLESELKDMLYLMRQPYF